MSFAWLLFLVYLAGTAWLGWRGYRKTSGFGSFAVGNRAMHPFVVGITLAASVSSAATFIINPGFVYVDGFSAFFHMSIGVGIGFILMLGSVADTASLDVNTMQKVLKQMSTGMGTALFTTLAGLVGSILLGAQYLLLDKAGDELIERTVRVTEVFILPRLTREPAAP